MDLLSRCANTISCFSCAASRIACRICCLLLFVFLKSMTIPSQALIKCGMEYGRRPFSTCFLCVLIVRYLTSIPINRYVHLCNSLVYVFTIPLRVFQARLLVSCQAGWRRATTVGFFLTTLSHYLDRCPHSATFEILSSSLFHPMCMHKLPYFDPPLTWQLPLNFKIG